MLRSETFEVVESDETFLDLPIESREVILPLGSPSSDAKMPLRLDSMHLIKREWTRMFVMKRCLQWPMRENELVTDTVDSEEEKRDMIDDAEFLKCYYFLFQLLYQSQRTVN